MWSHGMHCVALSPWAVSSVHMRTLPPSHINITNTNFSHYRVWKPRSSRDTDCVTANLSSMGFYLYSNAHTHLSCLRLDMWEFQLDITWDEMCLTRGMIHFHHKHSDHSCSWNNDSFTISPSNERTSHSARHSICSLGRYRALISRSDQLQRKRCNDAIIGHRSDRTSIIYSTTHSRSQPYVCVYQLVRCACISGMSICIE